MPSVSITIDVSGSLVEEDLKTVADRFAHRGESLNGVREGQQTRDGGLLKLGHPPTELGQLQFD